MTDHWMSDRIREAVGPHPLFAEFELAMATKGARLLWASVPDVKPVLLSLLALYEESKAGTL